MGKLLRVRSAQPMHLFSANDIVMSSESGSQDIIYSGDLCVFLRIDSTKHLLGRVVQFSYLEGSKRAREYSGLYVDITKKSITSIGVLANYYFGVSEPSTDTWVAFKPLVGKYAIGYLPITHYRYTIDSSGLRERDDCAFLYR